MKEKYLIDWTNRFKKDYKLAIKRGCDKSKIDGIIAKLASGEELPAANRDHALSGRWADHRAECCQCCQCCQ